jgi:hypothetical protein
MFCTTPNPKTKEKKRRKPPKKRKKRHVRSAKMQDDLSFFFMGLSRINLKALARPLRGTTRASNFNMSALSALLRSQLTALEAKEATQTRITELETQLAALQQLLSTTRATYAEQAAEYERAKKAVSDAEAPTPAPATSGRFRPVLLKKIRYFINLESGHAYYRNTDGTQGEWAGIFHRQGAPVGGGPWIDTSVGEPEEEEDDTTFILGTPAFNTMQEAVVAGRAFDSEGKKIRLNCPLGNPAWDIFKNHTGRAEGNARVDRILEALRELAADGNHEPSVNQLKAKVLQRHRAGHTYPLQAHNSEEEFIAGPCACTHTWICYMETYGLISILPQ